MGDIADALKSFLSDYGYQLALAANAASVAYRDKAQKKDSDARKQYAETERLRTQSISDKSKGEFQALAKSYGPGQQEAQRASEEQKLLQTITPRAPNSAVVDRYAQAQGTAPAIVGQQLQAGSADARETGGAIAKRKAFADSFGAGNQANAIQAKAAADAIARRGRQAQGSSRILGLEMGAANTAGNKQRKISDILGGLGSFAAYPAIRKGS